MAPDNTYTRFQRCPDPTHRRSEANGRCLDCRKIQQARYREKKGQILVKGAPRRAETIQGKPCRKCGCTERYKKSYTCVACSRKHGRSRTAILSQAYGVPREFTQWVTRPPQELTL